MVTISEYFDKRKGRRYYTTTVFTRNKKIADNLMKNLPEKFYYDEVEESNIIYRFRFHKQRKKDIKAILGGIK